MYLGIIQGWESIGNTNKYPPLGQSPFRKGRSGNLPIFSDPFPTSKHGEGNYWFLQTPEWGGNLPTSVFDMLTVKLSNTLYTKVFGLPKVLPCRMGRTKSALRTSPWRSGQCRGSLYERSRDRFPRRSQYQGKIMTSSMKKVCKMWHFVITYTIYKYFI